jgi:hypothetical protein
MTTGPSSTNTSTNDAEQDALRRIDDHIAGMLAGQVDKAAPGLGVFAASRGILPSTLARWCIGYMPAQLERRSPWASELNDLDLIRSGLFAPHRKTPAAEGVSSTPNSKQAQDDIEDRQPDLHPLRPILADCAMIPLRDSKGIIRTWIGLRVSRQKLFWERARHAGHEVSPAQLRNGEEAPKYRFLAKTHARKAYPLAHSPKFVEVSADIDVENPDDKKGKFVKVADKATPIVVCEGVLDAILAEQAGFASVALVGATAHPKQLDLLAKVLSAHAKHRRPIYACFGRNRENKGRKDDETGPGDRGMALFLAAMWQRNKDLARSIRVISLASRDDRRVDLADVLKDIYDEVSQAAPGADSADDPLAPARWPDDVIKAQCAKLEELVASSRESIEFLILQIPRGVLDRDRSSVLDQTGLSAVAAHDPELWAEFSNRVAEVLGIGPKDQKSWAKEVAKRAAKEALIAEKTSDKSDLARYINKDGTFRPTYKAVFTLLYQQLGRRLVYDVMTVAPSEAINEGRPWELRAVDDRMSQIRLLLADLGCDAGRDMVQDAVDAIARKSPCNPVESYLRALPEWDGQTDLIPQVISEVVGITEANGYTIEQIGLYTIYLRKWLRSAVARAFEPGCKADLMLVFLGTTQGQYKSSFVRALVPVKTWCGVPDMRRLDKDSVMSMRLHWIHEVPELERGSFSKDFTQWKAFLSLEADTFRPPYARQVGVFPRASVLFGTSNQVQILSDPTGSRRFLCIPIRVPIQVELMGSIRDALWGQLVAEYRAWVQGGRRASECLWWLTPDERRRQDADAAQFNVNDRVMEKLDQWLNSQPSRRLSADQIVEGARIGSGKDGESTHADRTILGKKLARLGWSSVKRRDRRAYEAPEDWQPKPKV